jgi:glucan phosphoethanolaminetransferase (alkaline phosphatase superfamily)
MQQKPHYWNNLAKVIFPVLIAVLIINVIISYFAPAPHAIFFSIISYALIMIIFAVVSLYMYRWQEGILANYNVSNLKTFFYFDYQRL